MSGEGSWDSYFASIVERETPAAIAASFVCTTAGVSESGTVITPTVPRTEGVTFFFIGVKCVLLNHLCNYLLNTIVFINLSVDIPYHFTVFPSLLFVNLSEDGMLLDRGHAGEL